MSITPLAPERSFSCLKLIKTHLRATMLKGPSIKYVTLFLTNFDPLPLSHFVTHRGPPIKYVTSRNTPPKDNQASICASELCKERSYKYRITAVLYCIVKKLLRN